MKLKPLLFIFIASTLSVFLLMSDSDPLTARPWQMAVFYFLVFLAVFSLTSVLGFYARILIMRSGIKYAFYRQALRQGVWLGMLTVIVLMLNAAAVFTFWMAILLLIIFSLIELYAISHFS